MKHTHLFVHLVISVMVIAGCASQPFLDRASIRNETGGVISQVRVKHEPTGKIGEVHSILPDSTFDLGFAPQPMLGKKAVVTWTGDDGRQNNVELSLPQRAARGTGKGPMHLLYTIHRTGTVTVEYLK